MDFTPVEVPRCKYRIRRVREPPSETEPPLGGLNWRNMETIKIYILVSVQGDESSLLGAYTDMEQAIAALDETPVGINATLYECEMKQAHFLKGG